VPEAIDFPYDLVFAMSMKVWCLAAILAFKASLLGAEQLDGDESCALQVAQKRLDDVSSVKSKSCSPDAHVRCPAPNGGNMCAGDQCCSGIPASSGKTFPCPSAAPDYNKCESPTKVEDCLPQTKCFHVDLEADPVAVPTNQIVTASGSATIMVTADAVTLTSISWAELSSPVIGLHIHEGDHSQNGGILVGFCGSSPLPLFSGTCPNAESATAGYRLPVSGQGCDLGEGACVGAKGTTLATIQGAAAEILSSTAPSQDLYLNLHTVSSFYMNAVSGANPLGLIRGQLVAMSC